MNDLLTIGEIVFRRHQLPNNDLADRAAALAERAGDQDQFRALFEALMTRSIRLCEDDPTGVEAMMDDGTPTRPSRWR